MTIKGCGCIRKSMRQEAKHQAETTRLRQQLAIAVGALDSITKSTIVPPDPNAHGWESFGRSAMALATDKQFKAINALAHINDMEK